MRPKRLHKPFQAVSSRPSYRTTWASPRHQFDPATSSIRWVVVLHLRTMFYPARSPAILTRQSDIAAVLGLACHHISKDSLMNCPDRSPGAPTFGLYGVWGSASRPIRCWAFDMADLCALPVPVLLPTFPCPHLVLSCGNILWKCPKILSSLLLL